MGFLTTDDTKMLNLSDTVTTTTTTNILPSMDNRNTEFWQTVIDICEVMYPFQAFFGITGNVINLFVLFSKTMKGRTNMLLSLVAIVDIIFLSLLSLNYLGQYTFAVRSSPECLQTLKTDCMSWYYIFYINYKSQLTFAVNLCSLISTWLIVTVCFDRLWAIKTPLKCRGATCSRNILTSVIVIVLVSIGLSYFHNFAFQVVRSNSTYNITGMNNGLHTMQPSPYRTLMKILAMIEVCFQILLPMILLIISNSMLLYYLRNRWQHFQVQRWNPSKNSFDSCHSNDNNNENRSSKIWSRRHSTNERKITTTVFGIVCCYIVTNLPSGILFITIYIVNSGEWYKTKRDYAFVFLSTGIVVFGKIANFFLLCNASTYFRHQIYKQIIQKIWYCGRKRASTPRVHYTKLDGVDIRQQ